MAPKDKRLLIIVHLGFAFMLLFTGFQTLGNIEQVVIDSIQKEDPSFKGSGYVSLAVISITFATSNWVAPSTLSFIGPKFTMISGSVLYFIFMVSFFWPQTWLLYMSSAALGVGAALLWTAQGNYLTLMSDKETISRNSGIFWAIFQCSSLFGNLFVFYQFQGQDIIGLDTRFIVFSILTAIGLLGVITMLFLPNPGRFSDTGKMDNTGSPYQELQKSFKLFITKEMMLLSVVFAYTGIAKSFLSGVYGSSISFTLRFEDSKRLVGISGIFVGCGEIVGGLIFGILGKKTIKAGRDPIILFGYLVHSLCYFLIFMNIPSAAPLGDTKDPSYFPYGMPSKVVAMICSFLLGFGDACFSTQIVSLLGDIYSEKSGPAFALYKFAQSLAAAGCFFYASVLELNWHLLILVIMSAIGTLTFCFVEWKANVEYRISEPKESAKEITVAVICYKTDQSKSDSVENKDNYVKKGHSSKIRGFNTYCIDANPKL